MLRTRSPLDTSHWLPTVRFSFDLHALSTPPAFVLSQDQTLHRKISTPKESNPHVSLSLASGLAKPSTRNSSTASHSDPGEPGGWRPLVGLARIRANPASEACLTGFWHTIQLSRSRMVPATGGAHYLRAPVASHHRNHSPGLRQHENGSFVVPDIRRPKRPAAAHTRRLPGPLKPAAGWRRRPV